MAKIKEKPNKKTHHAIEHIKNKEALIQMSHASSLNQDTHWFQMLPAAFFTAFIILITRMHVYSRDMGQFYWSGQGASAQISDFFSYFKMIAILVCAIIAIVFIIYRVFTQSLYLVKSIYYYPMIFYSAFVLLSYVLSDYKEFALWGYNDRFEGTLSLLGYMVMLFYIINTVRTERNVKWIIYPLAFSSFILGLLGISQATGFDFFRTSFGKKLITPGWFWENIDNLNFTFQNNEIYQTVYNINYVSFYLTLLIPLFGLLFIRSINMKKAEKLMPKIIWGSLFGLAIFNLIGSASSGGLMGMAAAFIVGLVILNKRVLTWWKPVGILLVVTLLIVGLTYQRWVPEFSGALKGLSGNSSSVSEEAVVSNDAVPRLDYLDTDGNTIHFSVGGNSASISTYPDDLESIKIEDSNGAMIELEASELQNAFRMKDARFNSCLIKLVNDDSGNNYLLFTADNFENRWPFRITEDGILFFNQLGVLVDLDKVPSVGFSDNPEFGSGRGYIFSRTIPMMKETLFVGHGADTYCLYFPHKDYVGKLYSGTFSSNVNIIVDKPHNMYMGMAVGTGGISLLAFLSIFGIYIAQSGVLYFRSKFESFNEYVGASIMFGICGFLVSGLVNDSTVSTFPMFYGLLGTGIAINMIIKREKNKDA